MSEDNATTVPQNLIDSLREVNQAIAESIVAAEERNMRFAQSTCKSALEVLQNNADATRTLMKELERQMRKQQEAIKKLTPAVSPGSETVDSYMALIRAPFDSYQRAIDVAESATRQGLETFQETARQSLADVQKATSRSTRTAR